MAEENDGIAYLMALKRNTGPVATASVPEARPAAPEPSSVPPAAPTDYEGAEKRRSTRYKCEGSAEMCAASCDVRTWATFTDISLHGCYVEAQATYPVGTVLRLKLEAKGQKIEAIGNVRVTYPYLGMGIAFVEMSDENRARLKEMLASISRPTMIMGPGIASSLPALGPLEKMPPISDSRAALQAVIDFFEDRQLLMREDFLRILRQSQPKPEAPSARGTPQPV
jgi:hypothetical protein